MNRVTFYIAAVLLHLAVLFLTKPPQRNASLQEEKKYLEVTLTLDPPPSRANPENIDQPKPNAPSPDVVAPEPPKPEAAKPPETKPEEKKSPETKPTEVKPVTPVVRQSPSTQPKSPTTASSSTSGAPAGKTSSSDAGLTSTGSTGSNANPSSAGGSGSKSTWSVVAPSMDNAVVAPAAQERAILAAPQPGMRVIFIAPIDGGTSAPSSGGKSGPSGPSGGLGNSLFKSGGGSQLTGSSFTPTGSKSPGQPSSGPTFTRNTGFSPNGNAGRFNGPGNQSGGVSGDGGDGGGNGSDSLVQQDLTPVTLKPVANFTPAPFSPGVQLGGVQLGGVSLSGVAMNGTGLNGNGTIGVSGGSGGGGYPGEPVTPGPGNVTGVSVNGPGLILPAVATPKPPDLIVGDMAFFTGSGGHQGHYFQPIYAPNGITWGFAQATAASHGGYLAIITSTAENNFVFKLIDDPKYWVSNPTGDKTNVGPWLGGVRATDSMLPSDGWIWLKDGSAFAYSNWAPGLPNRGSKAGNDYLRFYSSVSNGRRSTWSDAGAGELMRGFVVEYNSDTSR